MKTVSRDGVDLKRCHCLLSNAVFLLYTVHLGRVQLQTCLALPVGMASRTAGCIDNHLCNQAMATISLQRRLPIGNTNQGRRKGVTIGTANAGGGGGGPGVRGPPPEKF